MSTLPARYRKRGGNVVNKTAKLVEAAVGSVAIALLMTPMEPLGVGQYMWMLFLPMLLFFALGAKLRVIPSMIACYICGIAWGYICSFLSAGFARLTAGFPLPAVIGIIPTIIGIFLVLLVHQVLLGNTVLGNLPSLFLGICTTFFMFMFEAPITPLHLAGFFTYGLLLAVTAVKSGALVTKLLTKKGMDE